MSAADRPVDEAAAALLHGHQWQTTRLSRPGDPRLVLRYQDEGWSPDTLVTSPGLRDLVGKHYTDDSGRLAFVTMQRLHHLLGSRPARPLLAIPRPLAYDAARRVLWLEWVDGEPASQLLDRPDGRPHAWQIGRALADLHALPVSDEPMLTLASHLRDLIRPHPLELARRLPQHAPQIRRIVAELERRASVWEPQTRPAPIHRDVHLRQLLAWQSRVWLIDWDLAGIGDPALDLGNLLVYLATHRQERAWPLYGPLLAGYAAGGALPPAERITLYQAMTYLRLACKCYRRRDDGWAAHVPLLLATSEVCLATNGVHGVGGVGDSKAKSTPDTLSEPAGSARSHPRS